MKKVYFHTLGCRVNQYDTETLRAAFHQRGFESAWKAAEADVCVVNTCSVTAESDRKCRSQVRRIRRLNPEAFLVATGCYATGAPQDLEAMPELDAVIPSKAKEGQAIVAEVLDRLGLSCPDQAVFSSPGDAGGLTAFGERTRAFVKIEDGCNQMCTYCRIPFYRGRARSRATADILEEVCRLGDGGYHEIVLFGIQLGAFGSDTGESLPALLSEIEQIDSIERLRLSSIEPDDVTDELVDALGSLPKIAPHLHLPLQSGDDGVLQRMRRRYRYEDYRRLVERLRGANPDFAVSSDIMVGFPGETEEAFEHSVRAVGEIEFCRLHLFRFSARPGTKAAAFPDRIAQAEIDRRRERLGNIAGEVVDTVRRRQIGRTLIVLLEEPGADRGTAVGFSENYLRVQAAFPKEMSSKNVKESLGQLVPVCIETMNSEYLIGRVQ